uniref:Uncharacterized protein n=1 Tax=Meloidogyne javanica TaxID=6303 RepID=A0A915M0T7_MELJA
MHSSYSETVGQILPEGIERQLRSQLRALRFEHPQEYARLQQLEVGKFLASKSLHNWLSEWELSRWDEKYEGAINNSNKPVVVKFTLSRSGGGYTNEGMRSFDRDVTNNFEGMNNSLQYCKNNGWGRGEITTTQSPLDYDNVTEEMLWTSMPGKRSDWW